MNKYFSVETILKPYDEITITIGPKGTGKTYGLEEYYKLLKEELKWPNITTGTKHYHTMQT